MNQMTLPQISKNPSPAQFPKTLASKLNPKSEFKIQLVDQSEKLQEKQIKIMVDKKEKQTKKVIGELVASTFIKPMLAEMRNSPFKNEMFHGGQGEEIFGAQMDTIVSDRVTNSENNKIVNNIYKRVEQQVRRLERQRIVKQINQQSNGKVQLLG